MNDESLKLLPSESAGEGMIPAPPAAIHDDSSAAALLRAFLGGRSPRTLTAYRQDLEQFRVFTDEAAMDGAVRLLLGRGHGGANALALAYRTFLIERGLQSATINRRLAALRSLVKLARMLGHVPWALEVENIPHEPYRDTRGPGRDAVQKMIAEAAAGEGSVASGESRSSPRALRDRAALRLLYDLGLRRGEVVALDLADVDMERRTVSVKGKGRSQRTLLSLPEPTLAALRAWIAVRGDAPGPLFTSFDRAGKGDGRLSGTSLYRIVCAIGVRSGVKAAPHGLRHTAITEACKAAQSAGIGLEEVLDFSRHKSVAVLMIYRDRERNVQGKLASLIAAPDRDIQSE